MASRLKHVLVLSMSLTLILVLLVTVTVVAVPSGLADSATSSSSGSRAAVVAAKKLRREGSVISPRLDHHSRKEDQNPERLGGEEELALRRQRGSDVMAARVDARGKTWPQLVGMDAEEARQKILEEHPTLQVQIVSEGSMVTMDFNLRRVRIFKNEHQKVARPPRLG